MNGCPQQTRMISSEPFWLVYASKRLVGSGSRHGDGIISL